MGKRPQHRLTYHSHMAVARGLLALMHAVKVHDGAWECSCGEGGAGLTQSDARSC